MKRTTFIVGLCTEKSRFAEREKEKTIDDHL